MTNRLDRVRSAGFALLTATVSSAFAQAPVPPGANSAESPQAASAAPPSEPQPPISGETTQPGASAALVSVSVTGLVRRPGDYMIAPGSTVMEALMLAGGPLSPDHRTWVTRDVSGKTVTSGVRPLDFIQPGDRIDVRRRLF